MTVADQNGARSERFRVPPGIRVFVVTFAALVVYGSSPLPGLVEHNFLARRVVFLAAVSALVLGWLLAARRPGPGTSWRVWVARFSALCLTISVPAYALEFLTGGAVLVDHPWLWGAVRPWGGLHGLALAWATWVGSFAWRGRPRIAFVVACTLFVIMRSAFLWIP
jgi:hypothetical protein